MSDNKTFAMAPIPPAGSNTGTTVERAAQTVLSMAGWFMDGMGAIYDEAGAYVAASLTEVAEPMKRRQFVGDEGRVYWGTIDDFVKEDIGDQFTWILMRGYAPYGKVFAGGYLGYALARDVGCIRRGEELR